MFSRVLHKMTKNENSKTHVQFSNGLTIHKTIPVEFFSHFELALLRVQYTTYEKYEYVWYCYKLYSAYQSTVVYMYNN